MAVCCSLMQVAMCFIKLPGTAKHASVLVGVGIAEHDFLPAPPGIEQRLILGVAPQAAHGVARSAKVRHQDASVRVRKLLKHPCSNVIVGIIPARSASGFSGLPAWRTGAAFAIIRRVGVI